MYGQERLNPHYVLRYGWTKEFFEHFSPLQYRNIELPLTLVRNFHVFIRPIVNTHLSDDNFVRHMKKKHQMLTVRNAQQVLQRMPNVVRDLSKVPGRNTIVMPAIMIQFALEQFPETPVIITISNKRDKIALENKNLPPHFTVFDIYKERKKFELSETEITKLKRVANRLLRKKKQHIVFGQPRFKKWLYKHLIEAQMMVKCLHHLIINRPVGVTVDHVEIVNPGTTLSLLAATYNLPFINVPQVLISDRSLIPTRASHYLIWGENYEKWLLKRGIPSSKISIVGNLKFEYAAKAKTRSREPVRHLLRIPDEHLVVTFTTQPFSFAEQVNKNLIQWIGTASQSLPLTVIIRAHPYDPFDYCSLLSNQTNIKISPPKIDLHDLFKETDFMLTISSNTAIEAALYKKGILVLQPELPYDYEHHNNDFNAHLARARAGPVIRNSLQLRQEFDALLKNPQHRKQVVEQGQLFLKNTIAQKGPPSVLVRRFIQLLLHEKQI
ncbi:hypothetical protein ACFQ5F_13990 [Kroppenstedtia eburnea]|uniref:hypothetical protein n=1 Tax=Kroppenstedtia eburnea TaxID=714067 RepID=UPI00362BFE31